MSYSFNISLQFLELLSQLEILQGSDQRSEYLEQAERVRRVVLSVRGKVARSKHSQWWLGLKVGLIIVN